MKIKSVILIANKEKNERFAKGGQKVDARKERSQQKWVKRQTMSSLEKTCHSSRQKATLDTPPIRNTLKFTFSPSLPLLSPFFLHANNAIQPCTLKFLSRVSLRGVDNGQAKKGTHKKKIEGGGRKRSQEEKQRINPSKNLKDNKRRRVKKKNKRKYEAGE